MQAKFTVLSVSLLVAISAGYVTAICHPKDFGHGSIVCVCGQGATSCDGEFKDAAMFQPAKGAINGVRSSKSGDRFVPIHATFSPTAPTGTLNLRVDIDPKVKLQPILGFGGAFTDSTGFNLHSMSKELQTRIMEDYFGADGIGYRMARVPIGSTDFSLRAYSLDDMLEKGAEDETMTHFALANEDLEYKIPFMKWANQLTNNSVKYFAVAWGSPAWMKTNNELNHGGFLKGDVGGKYYKAYAQYLARFLEEYKKQEIAIWGVNVVNEPSMGFNPNYGFNSLGFNATQQRDFVKTDLGPALHEHGFAGVKLMIHDDNQHLMAEACNTILVDKEAAKYVSGVAFHWYANGDNNRNQIPVLSTLTEKFPDKFFLATEACELKPLELGNWTRAERYATDIMGDLNHGAVGWVEWNMALDYRGGPSYIHVNYDDTLMVNIQAGEYYKQPSFYVIGHFSRFVLPDSHRLQTVLHYDGGKEDQNLLVSVFERPDGLKVAVVFNKNAHPASVELNDPTNGHFVVDIKEHSIESFIWH